jgi:hypothetical protein
MNRRLLFVTVLVLLLAVVVIVWYFFYAKPVITPSLNKTNDPFAVNTTPKHFFFTNWINDEEEVSNSTTEITQPEKEALIEVWPKPATGQAFITQSILREVVSTTTQGTSTVTVKNTVRATSTMLMFVDRATGYIYGYTPENAKVYQISNTVVAGVHDAYIFNNGKKILFRYQDQNKRSIVSLVASIPSVLSTSSPLPLENMAYLPVQVTSVAVTKNNDTLSYLVPGDQSSSIYTLSEKEPLFVANSPFKEWSLSYGGKSLYATSKPSAYVEGSTVQIPSFNFIIGDKTGLISNPSESNRLISSMMSSTGLITFLSSPEGQIVLSFKTLASKCVWGINDFLLCAVPNSLPPKTEGLPDDWFQGRYFFEDSLVLVNQRTGDSSTLYSFDESSSAFDVTNPVLSPDNTLLTFIKKQTGSLWLLNQNLIPKLPL